MLPLETRKALGEIVETTHCYGGYRLKVTWHKDIDFAQVTMYDLGARMPLMWSKPMTKNQANGAIQLFESIGYFDMI